MKNFKKSFFILFFTMSIQVVVYFSFIQPFISTWGATAQEVNSVLVGDNIAPYIVSTRAIDIEVSTSKVWNLLTQLGADRGGFFAYTFLENILGYKTIQYNSSQSKNLTMEVGRIIPTTVNSNDKYSFPIVYVQNEQYFVLKNWGTFLLKKIAPNKTRLIIRTHGQGTSNSKNDIKNLIFEPLHYIMERRMFLGIKAKSENYNLGISPINDILWLIGIIFSAIGIIIIIFTYTNVISIILTIILSNIWLYSLLIFNPLSFSSLILFIIILITYILLKINANKT
jgi:hypothetical protein